ncbi:uncharacterized protein K444DRAFT_620624 [Hyaloscypha bicolor E]|uniref:Uncharacterized protein n=1 Tax=Hyaloscypha bicolor E TaxID=1095630 RepID=A0A2J6SL81_9HELO|nr:uncharacterized protein K444DRAFT_620624 [Hyaloscypha bicolor E]PMD51529.1 hypothetical protein K444DRAFT_620624 [Hyaloscypha bicolor E]
MEHQAIPTRSFQRLLLALDTLQCSFMGKTLSDEPRDIPRGKGGPRALVITIA